MWQDRHFRVDQNWLQFLFLTVAMVRSTPRRLPDVFVGDLFAADVVPVVVVCFNVVIFVDADFHVIDVSKMHPKHLVFSWFGHRMDYGFSEFNSDT